MPVPLRIPKQLLAPMRMPVLPPAPPQLSLDVSPAAGARGPDSPPARLRARLLLDPGQRVLGVQGAGVHKSHPRRLVGRHAVRRHPEGQGPGPVRFPGLDQPLDDRVVGDGVQEARGPGGLQQFQGGPGLAGGDDGAEGDVHHDGVRGDAAGMHVLDEDERVPSVPSLGQRLEHLHVRLDGRPELLPPSGKLLKSPVQLATLHQESDHARTRIL
mmetsp:Transcript_87345/g.199439  ORF Transcript_87345/g.199439 Transcript_87345/m.199439 type:complete len:214 (+) Transcript_87345:287-928(+)